MFQVCLRHCGEYLALGVPGLAEGRPSVLIGDKVILTDPSDPDGPCFEGYVHEVGREIYQGKSTKTYYHGLRL